MADGKAALEKLQSDESVAAVRQIINVNAGGSVYNSVKLFRVLLPCDSCVIIIMHPVRMALQCLKVCRKPRNEFGRKF